MRICHVISIFYLLVFVDSIIAFNSFEEASLFADGMVANVLKWWTEKDVAVRDAPIYKDMSPDGMVICVPNECTEGSPEQALQKWVPVMGIFCKECKTVSTIVTKFGDNFIQHRVRWRYKVSVEDEFKELVGDVVTYIDDNGKLTQVHWLYDQSMWEQYQTTFIGMLQTKNEL
eukprot:419371_1